MDKVKERISQASRKKGAGRVVEVLNDVDRMFSVTILDEIADLYDDGVLLEDIAKAMNRDVDEVFLALFYLARNGHTKRYFARRNY